MTVSANPSRCYGRKNVNTEACANDGVTYFTEVYEEPFRDCSSCSTCVVGEDPLQSVSDSACQACAMGAQAWWPCNQARLCKCGDSTSTDDSTSTEPEAAPATSKVTVTIGSSASNKKCVDYLVDSCEGDAGDKGKRVNTDWSDAGDRFTITVEGGQVCAKREGCNGCAWGMNLQIKCAKATTGDCVNPSTSPLTTFACPCLDKYKNKCGTDQACYEDLLCGHGKVCQSWKDENCKGNLVEEGSEELLSKRAQGTEEKKRVLDESLQEKCL